MKTHPGLKDLDAIGTFVHSFSSVFIRYEEEGDGKFSVALFPSATEKLPEFSSEDLVSQASYVKVHLVLSCIHAQHLSYSLPGTRFNNSLFLLRLGNTSLLGCG